jgi:hypothetical protein
METYTTLSPTQILITTPVTDADGNAVIDSNGNPVSTATILTLDDANKALAKDMGNLAENQNMLDNVQKQIDANTATIALDNDRIAAFTAVADPTQTPQYQLATPVNKITPPQQITP